MKILSGFLEAGEIRGRVVLGALEGGPTQSDRERGKKKKTHQRCHVASICLIKISIIG